ncbi:MAG: Tim44/TimA family putative adaptor protein [Alphaproteobacteria bacterium]|nr:Tim44/TimA family putative adaptor protein [Alphaproteobacteria bacterium]
MGNSQFLEILVLAMVAGVVLFRLYTVLGRRTGNERPPQERYGMNAPGQKPATDPSGKVVTLPDRTQRAEANIERPSDPVARGLMDIKLADRHFDTDSFIAGARQAYEMIVTAFAAGARDDLRPLLSGEVFAAFDGVIRGREQRGEKVEFTFVGLDDVKITEAALNARDAEITLSFKSKFISATVDAQGNVLEGDAKQVQTVNDIWTFARDVRSSDPNWQLVSTSGAEA